MASVGYASPPPQSPPMAYIPMPHPYLREPLLHISGLPPHVADADLARAFETCVPFRPTIQRDGSLRPLSGTIEFKHLDKAEKALATLQSRQIPFVNPPAYLVLSPFPPTHPPQSLPPPLAHPRLVKHLPSGFSDSALYDLFRPFGPLASVRTQAGFGKDTGVVEFWREEDARRAEEAMHCAEVGDQNIAVQVYQPRRASGTVSDFSPSAPAFVPAGMPYQPHLQAYSPHSPPRVPLPYPQPRSPQIGIGQMPPFVHGPGQQVQFAPLVGPGSGSASGLIDPCNLFCKNLDPEIDSNGLFTHFRPFGQIVSARVMRNDNGQSRGFGFVSFQTPDQASAAMHAMNGVLLGSKQIVVRLHEPKQLRQEKLAHRFASGGHNGHPRSASGATSPTASEGGESYTGWPGSVHGSGFSHPERGRRSSGSYYNAALTGKSNLPMRYDDLSALSPVVRKEVLTGELSRRVKDVDGVEPTEVESVVEALVGLSLGEVLEGIQSPAKLAEQVRAAKDLLAVPTASGHISTSQSSPAASPDSRLLDATASAPEHPSTPVSFSASISTPPRTSSPSGSVAPSTSERDRLAAAVSRLERKRADEITDLLLSLSHKERALCLFNKEYLKGKVLEARDVLDVLRSDDEPPREELPQRRSTAPPATPQSKTVLPSPEVTPQTPDLSSRGPSAAASPTSPATPSVPSSSGHTLASLARLPAVEIVKLANSPSATGLPLPKADPLVVKGTNDFVDSLAGKTVAQQKQLLGEKLFRVIKAFGIKGSPKITISLLDSEDLRALAHLMNSYPSVLKEKVLLATAAGIGSK